MTLARFIRCLCSFALLTFSQVFLSVHANAQRGWTNPCTLSNEPQKTACSFLVNTYEEMDDRCGIIPINRYWPPWNLVRHMPDYDVIPKAVVQDTHLAPLIAGDPAPWTDLNLPSLARIMTIVDPFTGVGNPPSSAQLMTVLQKPQGYPQVMQ